MREREKGIPSGFVVLCSDDNGWMDTKAMHFMSIHGNVTRCDVIEMFLLRYVNERVINELMPLLAK